MMNMPQGNPTLQTKILSPQMRTQNPSKSNASSSYYENDDFQQLWLTEFLSHEKAANVGERAANHLIRQGRKQPSKDGKSGSVMSEQERQRLSELSKIIPVERKKPKKASKGQDKMAPYVEANSKISRVLQHTKPKVKREDMQASQLNDFYQLVIRETNAAVRLQSQCRRIMAAECAKSVATRRDKATTIQSFVRASYARELFAKLKEEKRRATKIRERLVRLYVARCRRRWQIRLEHAAAVTCQSAIRMLSAKRAVQLVRLQKSWEANQRRWRALSVRVAWADLRVNFYARQIQGIVRRKLAKRRVSSIFALQTSASLCIQCVWRQFVARAERARIVYDLEVEKRCNKIRIIASEHQYWKQQVEDLAKPSKLQTKQDLIAKRESLEMEQSEKYEEIHALESHYCDQLQLQQQITPRAIAGGWEDQVKINLRDTRKLITKAKISLLFDVKRKLHAVLNDIEIIDHGEAEVRSTLDHFSKWQQDEQNRLWEFQRNHNREVEERDSRHSRVNEQLRWAVKHTVQSGKPDKRRPQAHRDVDCDEGQRVNQLLEITKVLADNFQEQSHLQHVFQPFQHMMDQCNALSQSKFVSQPMRRRNPVQFEHPRASNITAPSQKSSFPSKLPWHLIEKMRQERRVTEAKF